MREWKGGQVGEWNERWSKEMTMKLTETEESKFFNGFPQYTDSALPSGWCRIYIDK